MLIEHYEQLAASKQPWPQFYGRAALWGEAVRTQSKSKDEINKDFDSLQKFLTSWRKKHPDSEELIADIDKILTRIRDVNNEGFKAVIAGNRPQAPRSKDMIKQSDLPLVKFEPIEGTQAPYEIITRCGDKLDAVWNSDQLWLLPLGGDLKLIFERPRLAVKGSRDFLHEVLFDGRWLWVVNAETGLRVFDLTGKLLGHLPAKSSKGDAPDGDVLIADSTQLPPFDPKPYPLHNEPVPGLVGLSSPGVAMRTAASLRILPLGECRCLVAANYGPLKRLWIAVVTLGPAGSWDVKIIQQGTKVAQAGNLTQVQSADIAAEATWFTLFPKPQRNSRPQAILGRQIAAFRTSEVAPLIIDLTSLKVSVLPGNFREDGAFWLPVVAANGRLIQNTNHLFETIEPDAVKPAVPWKSQLFVASPNRDNSISVQGRFIADDDHVYVTTYDGWARLNTKEWKFDLIAPRPLPKEQRFRFHGVSSHYGLVAWNRNGPLNRVVIGKK